MVDRPFTETRVVRWGDCDPAGIIYAPRVFDYAMEALEAWYRDVLDVPWMHLVSDMAMGSPMVRAEVDFLSALAADQQVVSEVRVDRVGRASVTYRINGHDGDGRHCFRVTIVACFIDRPSFASAPIPADIRERMVAYQTACGDL